MYNQTLYFYLFLEATNTKQEYVEISDCFTKLEKEFQNYLKSTFKMSVIREKDIEMLSGNGRS